MTTLLLLLWVAVLSGRHGASGCTNILVTPGASADGSTMLAYAADNYGLMGMLYHYPASNRNSTGEDDASTLSGDGDMTNTTTPMRKIFDWDSGEHLGDIPESTDPTHNVVGNCNDVGLCIGETTFDGIEQLAEQPGAMIDYGSLIWITLQRSGTARDAIRTMSALMDEFGYASRGESFSLVDRKGEVWIMEVIGRGHGPGRRRGAVWVARRIPDGHVSAHANQARITTFPRDDPDNCLYSDDVVDLARELNLYIGTDADFSFSDTYHPLKPTSVRYGEARVWSIFSALSSDPDFEAEYANYAAGRDLTRRMPLWIEPRSKVSLNDVRDRMADHYEGTALQYDADVGAGPFDAPYRPRPQQWSYGGRDYVNERAVGIEKTGWNFIAVVRGWMPPPLSALVWFAVDDASTSPRVPVYACSTRVSRAYYGRGPQDGFTSPVMRFDLGKAFWVQNMVSNLAYFRWRDAYPYLRAELDGVHEGFVREVNAIDQAMMDLWENSGDPSEAVEAATDFSVEVGDRMHAEWMEFYGNMFARFRDFVVMEEDPNQRACGCKAKYVGLDEKWKERIVKETGTHYEISATSTTEISAGGTTGTAVGSTKAIRAATS